MTAPAKDWKVSRVTKCKDFYYPFRVEGENLNYAPESPFRHFRWNVPSIDNPRYDLTSAKFEG